LREYGPETLLSTSYSQTADLSFGATLVNTTNTCEKISIFKFSFKNLERQNISTLHYMETFAYTLLPQSLRRLVLFLEHSLGCSACDHGH
jgi:hypothetical protein